MLLWIFTTCSIQQRILSSRGKYTTQILQVNWNIDISLKNIVVMTFGVRVMLN